MEQMIEEIWVSTGEGAVITGYHRDYIQKLARDSWKLPEEKRIIKIRKRMKGYDIWLPDLIKYMKEYGKGPQVHIRKNQDSGIP